MPRSGATGPSDVLLDVTPVRASRTFTASWTRFPRARLESSRRIGSGNEGHAAIQYGAFGGLPEYCGARRNQWMGSGPGLYVPSTTGPEGCSYRGERCRCGLPPLHWKAPMTRRFGERWGDGAALEAALIQGVSRFRDPGRGQGLAFIKRFLDQWEGKISIRSGTARLPSSPPWDEDVPLSERLPFFPAPRSRSSFLPSRRSRNDRDQSIGHLLREAVLLPTATWSLARPAQRSEPDRRNPGAIELRHRHARFFRYRAGGPELCR